MEDEKLIIEMLTIHLRDAAASLRSLEPKLEALIECASAVVKRWESPDWSDAKHTGDYIHQLKQAIEAIK